MTILIPTLDRPELLFRALRYYEKLYFDGEIIIGDSSSDENAKKIIDFIEQSSLKITYVNCQGFVHDGACVKEMMKVVDDEYVVFQGDDDFLIPSALEKCAKFLDENKDYVACHGVRANVFFTGDRITAGYLVHSPDNDKNEPAERWLEYMANGLSTQNYVHRVDVWRKMYDKADKVPSRYLGPELLPCSLTVLLGMTKLLPVLHFVFHKDNPNRVVDWAKKNYFDYINSPEWAKSVKVVKKEICQYIDEATFNKGFWLHTVQVLQAQYMQYIEGQKIQYPEQFQTILMNPDFEFYQDFRQVYLSALNA